MKKTSRRSFIKHTSALSSGLLILPSLYSFSANNRLNIAVIGVGGRGRANWSRVPQENIVAMCDVDDNRAKDGYNMHPNVRKFKDFTIGAFIVHLAKLKQELKTTWILFLLFGVLQPAPKK